MESKHTATSSFIDSLKAKTKHLLISVAQDRALHWGTTFFLAGKWMGLEIAGLDSLILGEGKKELSNQCYLKAFS